MQVRQKLSELESTLAFFIGGGLAMTIMAFLLASASGRNANFGSLNFILIVGGLLSVGTTIAWLFIKRPWTTHDDWSEPLYTGHDHGHAAHDNHAEAHHEEAHHEEAHHAQTHPAELHVAHVEPVEQAAPAVHVEMHSAAPQAESYAAPVVVEAAPVAEIAPVIAATPVVDAAPIAEAAPVAASEPDDLTRIEGIGPKIAGALKAAGITTFAKVAGMEGHALEKIVKDAGVRMVGSAVTWSQQAALAAAGAWEALDKLQGELKGGRAPTEH